MIKNDAVIPNYSGFIMSGSNMSPTINQGDHIVVDLDQKAIRSGEIYIFTYNQSNVVCSLARDGDIVRLIFDGTDKYFEELQTNISVIGRVISIKSLAE